MSEQIIWASDSDCCEMCNGLLDCFGQCPHCGWDSANGYSWDDTDEDEFTDDWDYSEEEVEEMKVLARKLAREAYGSESGEGEKHGITN